MVRTASAKVIVRALPLLFYAFIAFFLINYLSGIDYTALVDIRLGYESLFLATLLGVASRYWGAYIWIVLLQGLSTKKINQKYELLNVYARSWLTRYIPGTATWIVSKVYYASKYSISKHKLAVSSLLEAALQVTIVLAVAVVSLLLDARFFELINNSQRILMASVLVGCIILLVPLVFNRITSLFYRLLKRKTLESEHFIDSKSIARGSFLYVIWSIIGGLALFFMAKSLYPDLGFENIYFVIGVSSLSGALGMIAFFAPSGIGIRESVQLVLLSSVMPLEIALATTVLMRLWDVVLDLLFYVSTILYAKNARNRTIDYT